MNLTQKTLLAHLKFLVLESAMMINDGYNSDEVIANLLKAVELMDSIETKEVVICNEKP